MRLTRSIAVATLAAGAVLIGWSPPATGDDDPPTDGWGSTTCDQTPSPACELGAGTGGNEGGGGPRPAPDPSPGNPTYGGHGEDGVNERPPGDQSLGPGTPEKNCRYVRSDYQPPSGGVIPAAYSEPRASEAPSREIVPAAYVPAATEIRPADRQGFPFSQQDPTDADSGAWYVYQCTGPDGVRDGLYRPPVFIPDDQAPPAGGSGPPPPSPEELARQAYNQLRLPSPSIAASPQGPQLVRLPTWLWIRDGWEPVSATASVPGVSVTATAKPTKVAWSMGEGGSRTCDGPGTAYSSDRNPRSASPDCGYTYRRASGGDGFAVSATVSWSVSWSGAGQSGTFDGLSTTDSTTFVVEEVGAVNGR